MDICLHFDQENGLFDALLSGPLADLQGDDGLMTAVIICPATGEAGGETACPMPRASRRWRASAPGSGCSGGRKIWTAWWPVPGSMRKRRWPG